MVNNVKSTNVDGILEGYTDAEPLDPVTAEETELLGQLMMNFDCSKAAKAPYENDWLFYNSYLKGDQLMARNVITGEVVRLSTEDSKRLRSQFNVLRPTARSLVGKMTRIIPTCVVLPATSDFEEQSGSRVATALLEYFRRKENLDLKYVEANSYLPAFGNAFWHLYFDRFGGRKMAVCAVCEYSEAKEEMIGQPCPQCQGQKQQEEQAYMMAEGERLGQIDMHLQSHAQMGMEPDITQVPEELHQESPKQQMGPLGMDQEVPVLQLSYEGDVKVTVRDPRFIYFEEGAISVESANWMCIRIPLPVSEARAMFPEIAESIHSEERAREDAMASVSAIGSELYGRVQRLADHCYILEYHEKRSTNHPKGRVIWVVNDRIARIVEESPYDELGRFPVYHCGFDVNPSELWREPPIAQAWHRQRELNRCETSIRESVELSLKPKLLNPIGSRITDTEITSDSGQIIKYNAAAGQVNFLQYPPLPMQVYERRTALGEDIRVQFNVTEQEMGGAGSDPNGRAMAIVAAEADQQIGPILLRNHTEWRELHRGIIILFRKFAGEDRMWSVVGPEGLQTFGFQDLNLQDGWDIQVEQDDGLSRNPAIRLQQAMELLNAGVFMDFVTGQPDIKAFMRHAKLNLPSAGYDLEKTERTAAQMVPYKLMRGEQHMPQPEDDPLIFAEELIAWLRGPGRQLVSKNPQVVFMIREWWMYYVTWAKMGVPPGAQIPQGASQQEGGGGQPNAGGGMGGSDMTAPGGTPNNTGGLASGITSNAQKTVQGADRAAESQARITEKHES